MVDFPSSFMGKGWHFPPEFSANGKEVTLVADAEDIQQSLQILLTTTPGERVLLEDFGCDLHRYMFEARDSRLGNDLAELVKHSISRYEPRIAVERVSTLPDGEQQGRVIIRIIYRILSSNVLYNMEFPFNLNEGISQ